MVSRGPRLGSVSIEEPILTDHASESPFDRWLSWFGRHSITWLDTLVRCAGIHNFLQRDGFTPSERQFLANGLRFISTPSSKRLPQYTAEFLTQSDTGWQRFDRTLTNRTLRDSEDATAATGSSSSYLSKFRVISKRSTNSPQMSADRITANCTELEWLERYRRATLPLLTASVTLPHHQALVSHLRANYARSDADFMQRLMSDATITIKPADKNLGLVLVETEWYKAELLSMLQQRDTYMPILPHLPSGKGDSITPIKVRLLTQLKQLAKKHESAIRQWSPIHADSVLTFLTQSVKSTASIPSIYLLIKVHKPKGLCGRPIVPSHSWLTTPASKFVDHLLQEIWTTANIQHIVKDTKSLVNELEHMSLSERDGVFLTADIATLYTNIDTAMGLILVRKFLLQQNVLPSRIDLIMDLLSFVMQESYLQFNGQVYQQIDGTAMGTAVAPMYANIVVYMLERQVIEEFTTCGLHLYRRFLDDIFAYVQPSILDRLQLRLNSLHPKLRFEFVTHSTEAVFLDLCIYKGARWQRSSIFDLRVHQKAMNLYLYIPWQSFHTTAAKRSFIQTELMRYIRNSSDVEAYITLKHTFYTRLRDRGYPAAFLCELFNSIYYDDRHLFLWPSSRLMQHPELHSRPPRSLCLLKRVGRASRISSAVCTETRDSRPAPVFVIPYSPLSRVVPTRQLLLTYWHLLASGLTHPIPRPIIAYQSAASLFKLLVFSKAKRHEAKRIAEKQLPRSTQPTIRAMLLKPDDTTGTHKRSTHSVHV